ncbi:MULTISPECIES: lipoate--protein ligase [Sneathia]|uniref:lipoate--protein ligase n=1 Tax=Sneathia vaginalis TaxID=187101 RepID=A0A0E3ZA90_9FUSO|nr:MULTISPECIES: lipoate--protein ligase [Sneathia]AKC95142.1 lipoate--protein ligase [Sneathia vaginalis]MBE3031422.1 lipoate--protein ligase [Sneathia sp. DSM 16631]MDK9582051.1 lipoate--protein ligase [Sneathia vaginalis]
MKYIVSKTNDTHFNMAMEEYCFKKLTDEEEIFILWINQPSIIIGKHQNAIEEINAEYVRENNICVARRVSGGGAVYHDLNNLNYTIISSKVGNEAFDFKTFSQPVINVLKKLGVNAEFTGRNDIQIDSKKICGNAQAYFNGRMMHHGCLLFNVDLTVLTKALKVSKDKIESKGIKSVRSRVTNILDELPKKITIKQFMNMILDEMKSTNKDFTEYVFTDKQLEEIKHARDTKQATWDWVYGKAPDYNIKRGVKYPSGKITTYADVQGSVIKNIKIYGDFFGINDVDDIEKVLIGRKYTYEDVLDALKDIDISKYFLGMTKEEVAKAICEI